MKFDEYLKVCRKNTGQTQEELVENLYSFDIGHFEGLNTSTLSKWERNVTQPQIARQVSIVKFFQDKTGEVLPCLAGYTQDEVENLICNIGVNNIIGKSKKFVLTLPQKNMHIENMHISSVRDIDRKDALLNVNYVIHQEFNPSYTQVAPEQFEEWAMHPSNFFIACEYEGAFTALLFTLRLKPEVFSKVLNFEMKKSDITVNDFATAEEEGNNFILSFFALNQKSATLIIIRYYAYLIAHQDKTAEVGTINSQEEAQMIMRNMNLKNIKSTSIGKIKIRSYRETLANIISHEYGIRMIIAKE